MRLNAEAFEKLLASLDSDREKAGEKYEQLRTRLLRFFEWRGAESPDELSDETLDRVSLKLFQGELILDLSGYVYGVARNVLRESWEKQQRQRSVIEAVAEQALVSRETEGVSDDAEQEIEILRCLERCLGKLSAENRELIIAYYQQEKGAKIQNRRQLASRLGIPINALRIRVFRIRERLELCVRQCAGNDLMKYISRNTTLNEREKE
jgi:RNA polymerase sigma factor (sigma-70 family)